MSWGAGLLANPVVVDSFHRPDSVTGLGQADSGGLWTPNPSNGIVGGISSDVGYAASGTGFGRFYQESRLGNPLVRGTVTWNSADGNTGLVFRSNGLNNSNAENCFVFYMVSTACKLDRIDAGTITTIGSNTGFVPVSGTAYLMQVSCSGSSIVCSINGTSYITLTDNHYETNTLHGWHIFRSAALPLSTIQTFAVDGNLT